jgi:ankyrin repeat protein
MYKIDPTISIELCEDKLYLPCKNGHIDIVKWLLTIRPHINLSINNYEPFNYALEYGHIDIAKYLFEKNPNSVDHIQHISLQHICSRGNLNILEWLVAINPKIQLDYNLFWLACTNNRLILAQYILAQNPTIDILSNKLVPNEILFITCKRGYIDIVKWLIDIHYKSYKYIDFHKYNRFAYDIKNVLIEHDLIDPSTLDEIELTKYLYKTKNVVPPDFINKYDKPVKIRGKHTKPALRE